jgi:YD repeat-containing protein
MKGYKATKNMKCLDLTYVVGKTYSIDKLEICAYGFHFCQEMKDVVDYYDPTEDFVLLEVEALGEIQTQDNKSATDKLKVIRVVPREEYTFDVCRYEYDSFGNKIRITSAYGHVYVYEYDSFGNMIKATDAVGNFCQYEYDSFGNMIKKITPHNRVYHYEYDSFGNKIKETNASNSILIKYEFNSFGKIIKKSTLDYYVQYEYDSFGNKIKEIRPSGDVWQWEYDSFGNKIKEIRPSGFTLNITIE